MRLACQTLLSRILPHRGNKRLTRQPPEVCCRRLPRTGDTLQSSGDPELSSIDQRYRERRTPRLVSQCLSRMCQRRMSSSLLMTGAPGTSSRCLPDRGCRIRSLGCLCQCRMFQRHRRYRRRRTWRLCQSRRCLLHKFGRCCWWTGRFRWSRCLQHIGCKRRRQGYQCRSRRCQRHKRHNQRRPEAPGMSSRCLCRTGGRTRRRGRQAWSSRCLPRK